MAPMGYVPGHSTGLVVGRSGRISAAKNVKETQSWPRTSHFRLKRRLVMMVVILALANGNNAAVGDLALNVLKLDGGVDHAEVMVQHLFHVTQDALAYRGWDVGDRDVTRKGPTFGADAPHVQVVHVVYAFYLADGGFHPLQFQAAWRALQQDVHGLA